MLLLLLYRHFFFFFSVLIEKCNSAWKIIIISSFLILLLLLLEFFLTPSGTSIISTTWHYGFLIWKAKNKKMCALKRKIRKKKLCVVCMQIYYENSIYIWWVRHWQSDVSANHHKHKVISSLPTYSFSVLQITISC